MILVSITVGILLALSGGFIAWKGLKIVRVALPFLVGLLGFLLVLEVLLALDATTIIAYGLAIVSGVLFAFGSYVLYKVAIVLQFAALGYFLTFAMFGLLNLHVPVLAAVIGTIFAVLVAIFAIMFSVWNYLIVIGTALNGASLALMGVMVMFLGYEKMNFIVHQDFVKLHLDNWVVFLMLILFAVVAIMGMRNQVQEAGGIEGVRDFSLSFFHFDSLSDSDDTK